MGRKSKLRRFAEVATFPNVFEHVEHENFLVDNGKTGPVNLKGRWSEFFFKNENSIILELACGKGEYTLALAQDDPYHNYIGVDVKGARIWKGAKRALDTSIPNAAFLRTRIEFIAHFLVLAKWIQSGSLFLTHLNVNLPGASPQPLSWTDTGRS